jgi:hypothetical protein
MAALSGRSGRRDEWFALRKRTRMLQAAILPSRPQPGPTTGKYGSNAYLPDDFI